MDDKQFGIVILAAGQSKRFKGNKLTAEYKGKMLFMHTLDTASDVGGCPVYVVTAQDVIKSYAERLGFVVVKNDRPELGISLSLRLGLRACLEDHPGVDGVLFCVCDQPELKADTIKKILREGAEYPGCIIRLRADEVYGNPCLWDRIYFDELMILEGDSGGKQIMGRHEGAIRFIDVPAEELSDIDFRSDLCSTPSRSL